MESGSNSRLSPLGDFGSLLPAELRVEIYKHALTTDQAIDIFNLKRANPAFNTQQPESDTNPRDRVYPSKGILWGGRCNVSAARILAVGLLLASKTINEEATAILYNLNTFRFASSAALPGFFITIGDKAALLAFVRLHVWSSNWDGSQLQYLRRLSRPRRIDVDAKILAQSAREAWEVFKGLVQEQEVFNVGESAWMCR